MVLRVVRNPSLRLLEAAGVIGAWVLRPFARREQDLPLVPGIANAAEGLGGVVDAEVERFVDPLELLVADAHDQRIRRLVSLRSQVTRKLLIQRMTAPPS